MDYREVLRANTVLDRKYRIDRVIGAGGFGITYQAFDIGLAAPVAIKEYYPAQFGMRDSTLSVRPRSDSDRPLFDRLRASFLREARTLAQFDHNAIVRVLSVFETHGTAYMVMRFESGPSLKAWIKGLDRAPRQAELDRLLWPLLEAIELMHMADFLHRDIAPDNIIVRLDGTPVLLDFGASRRVVTDMSGTLTGVVKQGYSPQEQYSSDVRSQGPWTDIYSLGATLYLCVTGKVPTEATARMLEDGMMPALEGARGGYRPKFLSAIDAAMQLHPRNRPQSVAEWREMLFEGAEPGWYPEGGDGLVESRTGPGSVSGPLSSPRSGPQSSSKPPSSAQARGRSQPRSGPRVVSGPGALAADSKPAINSGAGEDSFADPRSAGDAASGPAAEPGARSFASRAADFALSTQGAVALGIGAMLLGGSMLLAFEGGNRPGNPPLAGYSQSPAQSKALTQEPVDAARRELDRQAEIARQQKAERDRAEAARRDAERQAEIARQQKAEQERAEAARREAERQAEIARQQKAERDRAEAARRDAERQASIAGQQLAPADPSLIRQAAFADAARERGQFAQRLAAAQGFIVAGGTGGQLRLWNTSSGQFTDVAARHAAPISAVAVSADGGRIVSGSSDGEVRIWDARTGALVHTVSGGRGAVVALHYRTARRVLAAHASGTWAIIDPEVGQTLLTGARTSVGGVSAADIAADGKTIFAALNDGSGGASIEAWQPTDGSETRQTTRITVTSGPVQAIAGSPDGRTLVSAGADGAVRLWDLAKASEVRVLAAPSAPTRAFAFSRSGALVAGAGADGTVTVWQVSDGARVASFGGALPALTSVTFVGDGASVASASEDGFIRQWALPAALLSLPPADRTPAAEPAAVVVPKVQPPAAREEQAAPAKPPRVKHRDREETPRQTRSQPAERRSSPPERRGSSGGGGSGGSGGVRVPAF